MSTTADPKTRSFPQVLCAGEQGGDLPRQYTGAMRYTGLIGAGMAELLHLKFGLGFGRGFFLRIG